MSGHLATMVTQIASTASSRATAKNTYTTNVQSLFTATSGTVRDLFDGVYGTDFGTDFVGGMLTAAEGADVSEEAKDELFEKTMMDMVTMHLVLDKINGNTDQDKWDEAAAYYVGNTGGFSTYDRANKRAAATDFPRATPRSTKRSSTPSTITQTAMKPRSSNFSKSCTCRTW
jgi:hypothetical protein